MRSLLAAAQRPLLAQLAGARVLLGFDFDGTLAPIVAEPGRAALRATTRRRLTEVARLYPCVVVSGRAAEDVRARLAGIPLAGLVGNHGLEPWSPRGPSRAQGAVRATVAAWSRALARELSALEGVELEDKAFSLAIHYRRSRRKKEAQAAIARALAKLGELRILGGKQVVNVLPPGAPHKGIALERERERLGLDMALYVGDDETDEDVFALDRPGRLVTVRVGRSASSQASWYLRDQGEIDALLARLIELRRQECHQERRAAARGKAVSRR